MTVTTHRTRSKARAEDDGYRIGLDEFLAENPAD